MNQFIVYCRPSCFRCKHLKSMLTQNDISFIEEYNIDIMDEKGIDHVPMLEVDGALLNYDEALEWIEKKEVI